MAAHFVGEVAPHVRVQVPLVQPQNLGRFIYPTLPVFFEREIINHWSLLRHAEDIISCGGNSGVGTYKLYDIELVHIIEKPSEAGSPAS